MEAKIKTKEQIYEIIGSQPRDKKVIMAAGVFDLVHPGHLRHLSFAKSKGDILIVSVTSDKFVNKGSDRPHVPEYMRAENLAALQIVDYVIINNDETPNNLISYLKPDFYVKGFEYHKDNTGYDIEEVEVLKKYGGEIIFSPGDYVLSSTKLLESNKPDIRYDALDCLMKRENVTFDSLRRTLDLMEFKKIHVVGDTIVDTITDCIFLGAQTKTPTISGLVDKTLNFSGGAAIVAKHLKAAGADVLFTTVLGEDELGHFVCQDLETNNIKIKSIIDTMRPTTNKNSISIDGNRIVKLYKMDNRNISNGILKNLEHCVHKTNCEAIVFSDFRHGIFSRRTIPSLIEAIPENVFKVADSQVSTRWGNITEFCGFDLICPNEKEARFSLADQDSGIRALSSDLYDSVHCKTLMMKLGPKGVITCRSRDHDSLDSYFTVDSFADSVVDPVGCGDAFLAYATLTMLVDNEVSAAILGSMAAAIKCEHNGNIAVTKEDVYNKLKLTEERTNYK